MEPYNTLLFELFLLPSTIKCITGFMEFIVLYIVSNERCQFYSLKSRPTLLLIVSSRMKADDQMLKTFVEFVSSNIPTPKLIRLSILGTNFCVYEYP